MGDTNPTYTIEGELDWDESERVLIIRSPASMPERVDLWISNLPPGLTYYRVRITVEVLLDEPLADNPYQA